MFHHRVQRRKTPTYFDLEEQVYLSLDRKRSRFARSVRKQWRWWTVSTVIITRQLVCSNKYYICICRSNIVSETKDFYELWGWQRWRFPRSACLSIPHRPFLANINKPKELPFRKGYHVILLRALVRKDWMKDWRRKCNSWTVLYKSSMYVSVIPWPEDSEISKVNIRCINKWLVTDIR